MRLSPGSELASSDPLVTLVDQEGRPVGSLPKSRAHLEGSLHLAFSIFVFNRRGQLLVQQRAREKYHSAGLWSNSCCGHPAPGVKVGDAASRRLREEMGFSCPLRPAGHLTYRAAVSSTLTEHEFDYLFMGRYDGEVHPDRKEAMSYEWRDTDHLTREVSSHPERYTVWFRIAFPLILAVRREEIE